MLSKLPEFLRRVWVELFPESGMLLPDLTTGSGWTREKGDQGYQHQNFGWKKNSLKYLLKVV